MLSGVPHRCGKLFQHPGAEAVRVVFTVRAEKIRDKCRPEGVGAEVDPRPSLECGRYELVPTCRVVVILEVASLCILYPNTWSHTCTTRTLHTHHKQELVVAVLSRH